MVAVTGVKTPSPGNTFHVIWETLTENDEVGHPVSIPGASDVSVEVLGTIGGATLLIEGSNVLSPSVDGDWVTLHDENGDLLSFTTIDIGHALSENMLHIRPRLSGGAGTDVDVIMLFRSTM